MLLVFVKTVIGVMSCLRDLKKKVFRVVCNVFARWVERCSCSDFLMFLENVFREDLKAVQFSEELFVCTSIWNQAFTV